MYREQQALTLICRVHVRERETPYVTTIDCRDASRIEKAAADLEGIWPDLEKVEVFAGSQMLLEHRNSRVPVKR